MCVVGGFCFLLLSVAVSVKVNVFLLPSFPPPFLFLSLHLSFVSIHLFIFHPPVCLLFYSSSLFFLTLFYFPLLHPCVLFRFINRSYTLLFVFVCLSLSYSSHCFLFSLFFPAIRHLAESLLEATLRHPPPTPPSLHTSHSKFSSCCTFVSPLSCFNLKNS